MFQQSAVVRQPSPLRIRVCILLPFLLVFFVCIHRLNTVRFHMVAATAAAAV